MRKTKTKSRLLVNTLTLASLYFAWLMGTSAASIDSVEVPSDKKVVVTLTWSIFLQGEVHWDVKVLKDVMVEGAMKSFETDTVINIALSEDLMPNRTYSLLSIFGAEGNIDFTLGESVENVEFLNTNPENATMEKVVVVDSRNIDVYYKLGLKGQEFEYKILSSLGVASMQGLENKVTLELENKLESNSDYILMVLSMSDEMLTDVELEDGIFDFMTGEVAPEVVEEVLPVMEEMLPEETDLNAAPEVDENLELMAATAEETPDTGAETWVILLASLLVHNGMLIAKRRKQKMA